MIKLEEVNQSNWQQAVKLSVNDDQKGFLDSATGIIARGYIYRDCRAKVWTIINGESVVGLAMVRDLNEEPACYELQQFMIDARRQNRGYGTRALRLILDFLAAENRYDCVEVCVKRDDAAALRLYERAGFADTGYVDPDAPDCLNLTYRLGAADAKAPKDWL